MLRGIRNRFDGGEVLAIFRIRVTSAFSSLSNESLNKNRGAFREYRRPARIGAMAQKSTPSFSKRTNLSNVTSGPRPPESGWVLAPMPIQLSLPEMP